MQKFGKQNTAPFGIQNSLSHQKIQQEEERTRLYAEIVRKMPVGLSVWRLANPDDVRTFTLILDNPAAREASGAQLGKLYGKTLAESFPGLLETEIPKILREVALSGKTADLGEIRYAAKNGPEAIFSAKAFPLPNN